MARPRKDIKAQRLPDGRFRIIYAERPEWIFHSPETEERLALAWARRNKAFLFGRHEKGWTFAEMSAGFFDEGSAWNKDQEERGRSRIQATIAIYRGILQSHLAPALGDKDIREISAQDIDKAIKAAETRILRGGKHKPLSRGTRNKALHTISLMYKYWMAQGLVDANPASLIDRYNKNPEKPRGALPRDVLQKIYPTTHGEAVQVWGSSMWAAFFCLLNDTGARPGEIRSLRWGQIYFDRQFVPLRTAIQAGTTDTVKGTKSGAVKPGFLSPRTIQELRIWRAESKHHDDLDWIFTKDGEKPVSATAYLDAFRAAMRRQDLDGHGWTPYWLRHTFGTYGLEVLSDQEIMLLMGHASVVTSKVYRHPDDETVFRQGASAKEALDKARKK